MLITTSKKLSKHCFRISTYKIMSSTNDNRGVYSSPIHIPCMTSSCQTILMGIYIQHWWEVFTAGMLVTPQTKSFHLSTLNMFIIGFSICSNNFRALIYFLLIWFINYWEVHDSSPNSYQFVSYFTLSVNFCFIQSEM